MIDTGRCSLPRFGDYSLMLALDAPRRIMKSIAFYGASMPLYRSDIEPMEPKTAQDDRKDVFHKGE